MLLDNELQAYGEFITFNHQKDMPKSFERIERDKEKDPRFERINKKLNFVEDQSYLQRIIMSKNI